MANIIITDYCNLKCPYCFAEDMIASNKNDDNKYISYENFMKILNWMVAQYPQYDEQIGIIGGEPTLHPMFFDILSSTHEYSVRMNTNGLLFSNGVELEKWLPIIAGYKINVLINCNSPKYQSEESYQKTINTILRAESMGLIDNDRIRLGCNIYLGLEDYSYFWNEMVDKARVHIVRCSVVSPGGCYMDEWRKPEKKEEYYTALKSRFLDFINEAKKRNIVVSVDCNNIPPCYFTDEEKKLILSVVEHSPMTFCKPAIDIDKNLHVTSCFGTYDINKDSNEFLVTDFANIASVKKYLLYSKNLPKVYANNYGKCGDCNLYKQFECQGGCLSFSGLV